MSNEIFKLMNQNVFLAFASIRKLTISAYMLQEFNGIEQRSGLGSVRDKILILAVLPNFKKTSRMICGCIKPTCTYATGSLM